MIRERLLQLRERRAVLVARAEQQREAVHGIVVRAEAATAWFDRARTLLGKAREHPVWIAAGVALFVALRPRKSFRLLAAGFSFWRGWRSLRAMLERIGPRQPARSV